jgi:thiamine-monophosphate kinase
MSAPPIFTRSVRASVAGLGEQALIRRIRRWLGSASPKTPAGIGDDCALLRPVRGRGLITVDPVVHGVHFDGRVPARSVGAKLFKRNLSDIAAMGGSPRAAVVALALDPSVSIAWLGDFFRGLAAESCRHKVPVVGGDVARLKGGFVATLALTGEAGARVLTRKGSRVGDWIYVTGRLGRSLQSGRHHSFQPRLAEGQWLARRREVRSMMDVSDGLAKDLPALTPAGATAALYAGMLPLNPGAGIREALGDGEDYELVIGVASGTRREKLEQAWRKAFPRTRLTCIGRFVRRGARPPGAIHLEDHRGYEHLR